MYNLLRAHHFPWWWILWSRWRSPTGKYRIDGIPFLRRFIYPYNRKYLDEVSFLEEDAYIPNYEKAFNFLVENRNSPTLVFLYSVHTDHAGHKYKWMSPEYIRSIEEADVEIGKFIDKMRKEGLYDDTHFMFLSDHGGIEYGHGGVSVDEMIVPWGIVGPGIARGGENGGSQ